MSIGEPTTRTSPRSDRSPDPAGAGLQDLALDTADVQEFLDRLVVLTAEALDGRVSAGITLARARREVTVASSDPSTSRYDELQYGLNEGPCLTALRAGTEVLVPDLASEDRFPSYREHALPLGLRSCLAVPLAGDDRAAGALNMYSREPGTFDEATIAVARQFAGEAARALRLAMRLAQQAELTDQLRTALGSRAVIDQAIGVIMAQSRCGPEAAFEVLRTASQHRNAKLRDLAAEIVTAVALTPVAAEGHDRT
ncbi:GAF and ANTAR domain-containing protein [Actinotalea sp. BY-33]|uniref:GAF and ANTAR domain-containing protein n=1 Tax=Actinotalea soli TaxID=2819234 RepID=A0A939LUT3_9CELL|nr:GAF and ANTAR domain-containing protein [Actinotalea soli]MBO1751682.1 GAF and ANTAR domain-containing protein [Actinotalea soli]